MDQLNDMATFASVVAEGSSSRAAHSLGLSKATISKRISRLEDRLGARLLNRTTRRLSLTEVGSAFHEHCSRLVAEAEEAEQTNGAHGEPAWDVAGERAHELWPPAHCPGNSSIPRAISGP